MKTKSLLISLLVASVLVLVYSCGTPSADKPKAPAAPATSTGPGDPMQNKGIGPVTSVVLGELDPVMAKEGEEIFNKMCTACHKPTEKSIGPAPKGILKRRSPEWIMNMILSPDKMILQDPIAKQLLVEYNLAPMANQNLTQEQARKILEYFRTLE
jgi:mono/diheme cytochrome c family protein